MTFRPLNSTTLVWPAGLAVPTGNFISRPYHDVDPLAELAEVCFPSLRFVGFVQFHFEIRPQRGELQATRGIVRILFVSLLSLSSSARLWAISRRHNRSTTLRRWIQFGALLFAVGLIVGYVLPRPLMSPPDRGWQQMFNEEMDHKRIMAFEDALAKEGSPKDAAELSRQLDTQLRIEDLIVKSREAEYAKFTALSWLFTAIIAFLGGILGALVTHVFTRSRPAL